MDWELQIGFFYYLNEFFIDAGKDLELSNE